MTQTLTARTVGGLNVTKVEERSPFLNLGIYGDSGVGKTVLAGSASAVEEMSPVLCVDLEGGTESLRRTYPSVEVVRAVDFKEMQEVYSELFRGKGLGYRTVLVDSTTEAQTYNMAQIMKEKLEQDPGEDPDLPEWKHHNKNLIRMRAVIRGFRDLPMHTIFTSLSLQSKDNKTGVTVTMPKYSGAFKDEYPALIDVLLYYYTKEILNDAEEVENHRFLLSSKTEKFVAKDRTGILPQVMQDPTMHDLFSLLANAKEITDNQPVEAPTESDTETQPATTANDLNL